mmetsp:Transcript_16287/g.41281  ORF Transcript_16287/g.41281 Transcript_16287/m.41281 type:complete len:325 (+) Transcript_16287:84-1058(+)|eukprot:CAMPEP_0113894274 /NCGR_PEP_ID=MMETSP0780_2-20120614/16615_1 /TAXON_ID=652834 /ORGANISM="Palpitomonas bilix" /LENGTH=324 /DNA_ID=CAMNT_0000884773 /DNA_START=1 /DNA_END=975 /DNA_ORIENTATION=- /assembly_acc=CAM_ASM_000599
MGYDLKIIAGNGNRDLAAEIARHLGRDLVNAEVSAFADGEIRVVLKENIRGTDVFVIQSTCPPVNHNIMEMLVIIDALKRASAKRITAVLPYYGYARQDRKAQPRVPITAKLVADLVTTAGAHRVLTMDLHAGQIQGFFNIPVDHLTATPVVMVDYLRNHPKKWDKPCVVSPDAGGMERARQVAELLQWGLAVIDKRRESPNVAKALNIIGDVKDRDCVIVDDMLDTGGSLKEAASVLKNNGAKRILACCVHPVMSGPAAQRIGDSDLEELVVSNSIPVSEEKMEIAKNKVKVQSVARLFSEAIRRIHNEESISILFDSKSSQK